MSEFDPTTPEAKAAIKAAIDEARAAWESDTEGLKAKNKELLTKLRQAGEIKPEDLTAAEDRADKAEAALNEANKALKAATGERDKAVKALEAESGAARSYALEAEITDAIAKGNVVPALVPALKAMVAQQAKADLVDGKYAVMIGDKAARDYIGEFLDSDDGKHFKAAAQNGGGGAPGGGGGASGAKVVTRAQWDGMDHAARSNFSKDGGKVVDAAA